MLMVVTVAGRMAGPTLVIVVMRPAAAMVVTNPTVVALLVALLVARVVVLVGVSVCHEDPSGGFRSRKATKTFMDANILQ